MQSICLPQKKTHEQKRGEEGRNEGKGAEGRLHVPSVTHFKLWGPCRY